MLNRRIEENGLLEVLDQEGMGCIAFCPLAQGMLTNKYIEGIPEGSRATKQHGSLKRDQITDEKLSTITAQCAGCRARSELGTNGAALGVAA